jgi:aerobic carbon-monoxide dehydrogenase large subunit
MEPGLEETAFYDPANFVFPFGAHACVVEVDAETGKIDIVRYLAVDDCGPAINPLLIDGQVHGGIAQAIGQALYERIHYDEDGQLVTGTFVDYALPSAADLPSFELDRTETPSTTTSMGVKGIGEAGTIAASPAVLNAVVDALRPLGVSYLQMPLSPMRVWETIQAAQGAGGAGGDPGSSGGGSFDEHGSGGGGSGPARPDQGENA